MEIDDHVCTMSSTNIIIPNDIIIEIFSRVPAKSLLRLRWACKYLFDLITRNPAFIMKNYLHHHTTTTNTYDDDYDNRIVNNTSFWVSNSQTVVYTMKFGDVVSNDHESGELVPMDCYNLPFSNLDNDEYFSFRDSCNGLILICLVSRKEGSKKLEKCWVWNPCTREVRQIPNEPSNTYPVNDSSQRRVFGFGYDHTINDYKVIRITQYYSQPLNGNVLFHYNDLKMIDIGVYTLGSNSWSSKIVTDPILTAYYKEQIRGQGLLVNGALHFIRHWGKGTITSFDIIKEEFREIEGPNLEQLLEAQGSSEKDYVSEPMIPMELSVLNGCLCICQMTSCNKNYVIWMMKDYGVKDSWTKLFTINVAKTLASPSYDCRTDRYFSEPFEQYYKDGGILMVFNKNARDMIIVACDSKNDNARFIYSVTDEQKINLNYLEWFVNGTYTESLVSLNSGMYLTLAAGSRRLSFQKLDLLEYKVRVKIPSRDEYLVRKEANEEEEEEEVEED